MTSFSFVRGRIGGEWAVGMEFGLAEENGSRRLEIPEKPMLNIGLAHFFNSLPEDE